MTYFKSLSFRNYPSIATKLVKFLAVNPSFESINLLLFKRCSLEAEASGYKRQIAKAVKSAASWSNKADEAKKLGDSLTKHLTKLEEKAGKLC
jgi:hypothetical protein